MTIRAIETTLEGLREELQACPATPRGYSEAAYIRHRPLVVEQGPDASPCRTGRHRRQLMDFPLWLKILVALAAIPALYITVTL